MVSQHKASKGTVQIKISNDRLQLVFSFGGKRHYLSTGFPDTKANRKLAEMKARQIELDILCNNFDITLGKYKPQSEQIIFTPSLTPVVETGASLADLWDSYTEYKRSSLSPSTLAKGYKSIYRCINVFLPIKTLDKAVAIRDWLIANKSPLSAKKTLTQFSACCNWAVKSQLIEDNPFEDMASDIKVPKGNFEETDINPFSVSERDRIIQAFKENRYYKHYAPLIEFLFITGCRPSEAVALQWKHIASDFTIIRLEQAVVLSLSGLICKPGLKTQKKRVFPINNRLAGLLKSIQPVDVSGETKVFPSPEGNWIDVHNLSKRAWKTVLKTLDSVEYRNLYQTRHTFITMALKNGVDVKDVATMVGNSPEIIYRHYAGQSRELFLPEF
ncbi:Arm DNA-binding domain-containing protein [Brunnivagina elsteri]|uniref:Site-specific integrase n=1 Tax=Brunnivagina elsteri CCALA 953 TaxID=987040 RepID=A0A2A2T9Y7_9CYAN|nr:tyrosine-type recombinase/integrase [Calothrix elsteri]PAX45844.1 site-specific integrase [Calothrix elsteri CCALA 953]